MTNVPQATNGKFNLTLPPVSNEQFFRLGPPEEPRNAMPKLTQMNTIRNSVEWTRR